MPVVIILISLLSQASKALDRRDDLQKLKAKLSFNREILHSADPASKPWLRKTSGASASATIRESKDEVDAAASGARAAGRMDEMYSLHTASPAQVRREKGFLLTRGAWSFGGS